MPVTEVTTEAIKAARERSLKDCQAELHAALERHGCKLIASPALVQTTTGGYLMSARVDLLIDDPKWPPKRDQEDTPDATSADRP